MWLRLTGAAVRDRDGSVAYYDAMVEDVTGKYEAAAEMRLLQHAVEAAADAFIISDRRVPEHPIVYVNPAFEQITGYPPEDVIGRDIGLLYGPETDPAGIEELGRAAAEGRDVTVTLLEYRKDGSTFWNEVRLAYVRDESGAITHVVGVNTDVTDRRRAVSLLDALLESAPVGIAFLDRDRRYVRVNATLARLHGRRLDEYPGKTTLELVPGIGEPAMRYQRQVLETGESLVGVEVVGDVPSRPGETSHFLVSYYPVVGAPGEIRGVGVVTLDVTERARLLEQVLQAQKMEAVGQLAGGVAHDFNNLLTAINSYAELVLQQMGADHELRTEVEEIRAAGERAAALIRQLLAFGRRQVISPRVLDLNELVGNLEHMLRRVIGEDVELAVVSSAAPALVTADPGQLEQVVVNLVVNARDAMPMGGRVELGIRVLPDGHEVELSVTDTGFGIDEATRAHIFEPFFTTKEVDKGTGLGLSTVFGIVEQSGGRINVESEPGRGASFRVALPLASGGGSAETGDAAARTGAGGTETILLVEDDPVVRELVRTVLADRGYTVLATAGAQDAIDASAGHHAGIDLLLTDIVMPGMRGPELAEQIRLRCPGVRVVYMSGYADDVLAGGGEHHFVQKPFSPQDLAAKVREVLGR